MIGVIIKWNPQKGYGFIRSSYTGEEFFYHYSELPKGYIPVINEKVEFDAAEGKFEKLKAVNIRLYNKIPEEI